MSSAPTKERQPVVQGRNLNWDLIRVVAVAAVVIGHVSFLGPVIMPGIDEYPVAFTVRVGAAALVVLSAYFACVTIRRSTSGWWLRRRMARLLPAYLAAAVITYVISRVAVLSFNGWQARPGVWGLLFGQPYIPANARSADPAPWHLPDAGELLANLALVQPWNEDWRFLDYSYWTLPLQVSAFLCAALLWRHKLDGARLRVLARSLVLLPIAVLPLMLLPEAATDVLGVVYGGLGIPFTYLFGIGILIWLWSRRSIRGAELTALTAVAVVMHARAAPEPVAAGIAFAVMVGLIALAARGPDWNGRVLLAVRRPVTWLAGISYGVYLVHQQLGYVLARVLSDAGMPGWPRLLVVLAAVVCAGWLLTVAVERPLYRALTRRRPQREPLLEPAPARPRRRIARRAEPAAPSSGVREPELVGARS